jgi:prepilin-type N-terminal cleavage/methylation domain-containing protein
MMPAKHPDRGAAGLTLVEVMIALVVVSIAVLAFARVFPATAHSQLKNRMGTMATQYANETFEKLRGRTRTDALLATGRHPATGFETLGTTGAWRRYYVVTQMSAPLDSLLKIDVRVRWTATRPDSTNLTGYIFP